MADRDRDMAEITPQELLMRSNPGVFSNDSELSRDLTNPREMYNILAYKAKSNDDLAARFKQELSKSLNTPGLFPKLARTVSMNELKRNPNQFERLGNKPFHGSQIPAAADKNKLNVYVLTRHRTCIGNVRTIAEEEKENLSTVNLPNIARNTVSAVDKGDVEHKYNAGDEKLDLPEVSEAQENNLSELPNKTRKSKLKRKLSNSDPKLDKWFSEMPNEVFDKAQRALMEESIKDRLHRYQEDRSRRPPALNQHVQSGLASRGRRLPNTFLEVNPDSFGRHLQHASVAQTSGRSHLMTEKEEKMNRYKLQQKSALKLKMRDLDALDRRERTHDNIDMAPRVPLQPRALTTLDMKSKQQRNVKDMEPDVIKIRSAKGGLKTVNINDVVNGFGGVDNNHNSKYLTSDIKAKLDAACDEETMEEPLSPPPNSAVMPGNATSDSYTNSIDKETAKATVVTLALKKEEPVKRKPFHIEKTMLMNSLDYDRQYDVGTQQYDAVDGHVFVDNKDLLDVDGDLTTDKVVTKIPTAGSQRTGSNKSSSSSVQSGSRNKSLLKKFNTLEVFAESSRQPEPKVSKRGYQGQKFRDFREPREQLQPSIKLDLKHVPHAARTLIKDDGGIVRSEVRPQEVVFRFEPGEVFISTKKSNPTSHAYNNRSSERARIIYGKAVHGKDDKHEAFLRQLESRGGHSANTSTNFRRDNNRDIIQSARNADGLLDNVIIKTARNDLMDNGNRKTSAHVNVNGVMVRDMAIETDVIGSEPITPNEVLKNSNCKQDHLDVDKTVTHRSSSGLTEFIVDDNDGESLDSDTEREGTDTLEDADDADEGSV